MNTHKSYGSNLMEHRLTRREFVKNLGAGLVSTGLLAGSTSVLGAENKGGIMKDDDLYYIQTVRDRIRPGQLGMTLIHEHVMVDFIGADKVSKDRYDVEEVFEVIPGLEKEVQNEILSFIERKNGSSRRMNYAV